MAKKKVSRKELLKSPDEFVTFSSRAAEFAKTHQQKLKFGGIAIAIIVAGYLLVNAWMDSMHDAGQNAYNQAVQSLEAIKTESDRDTEALNNVESLFTKVTEEYGMSKRARLALPQIAHVNILEKNYSEAVDYYQSFIKKVPGKTQYDALARLALAACYEAEGDVKSAVETLAPLEAAPSNTPFREFAMWRLARLYRLDHQPDKEKETLEDFVEKYKDSPFHAMAKARL